MPTAPWAPVPFHRITTSPTVARTSTRAGLIFTPSAAAIRKDCNLASLMVPCASLTIRSRCRCTGPSRPETAGRTCLWIDSVGTGGGTMRVGAGLALVLVWLSSGCGGNVSGDVHVPVSGKVTYKGEPLTTGTVILVADAAKGNSTKHEPRGSVDDQGNFEVSTAGKPGAPPGWYKVAVVANKPGNPSKLYAVTGSLLPKKYGSANSSEIAIEVTEK